MSNTTPISKLPNGGDTPIRDLVYALADELGKGRNSLLVSMEGPAGVTTLELRLHDPELFASLERAAINPAYPSFKAMERDALDAARYRWLRSEQVATDPRYYPFWNEFNAKLCREEKMDSAIDAAMETCK